MSSEYQITFYAVPAFLFFVIAEYLIIRKKHKEAYRLNDTITNLNIGVGHLLTKSFVGIVILFIYQYLYKNIAVFTIPASWWSYILALVLYDFCFYWAHRWGHTVNLFWGAHLVHHQSEYYNLSVALRQSWIHTLLATIVFLPIPILGIPIEVFGIAATINSFYQFWIHTEAIDRMPSWIEYLFNTPSHHRVHHAINPKYIDRNHAGMFMIWDRIFGTFRQEEEVPTYGITTPLNSWNPVWANMHYYVSLWTQSLQCHRWYHKIYLWFAKPGWLPEELGGYKPAPEVDKLHYRKYDLQASKGLNIYVLMQFGVIIVGLMAYMYFYETMGVAYQAFCFLWLMFSMVLCGAILEQRPWAKIAEYFRWASFVVAAAGWLYLHSATGYTSVMIVASVMVFYFVIWYSINTWLNVRVIDVLFKNLGD